MSVSTEAYDDLMDDYEEVAARIRELEAELDRLARRCRELEAAMHMEPDAPIYQINAVGPLVNDG